MSNVKMGKGSGGMSSIPSVLRDDDMMLRMPPDTISSQLEPAHKKAGMTWEHPQLGPQMDYVDGEEANPAEHEDGAYKMGGKLDRDGKGGMKEGKRERGSKMKHRAVTGAKGMPTGA